MGFGDLVDGFGDGLESAADGLNKGVGEAVNWGTHQTKRRGCCRTWAPTARRRRSATSARA